MKITGRADLGKIGKQSRMKPDTQAPWPATFTTQKAPLLLVAVGMETPSAAESAGDVLRGMGPGRGGGRDVVFGLCICVWGWPET